MHIALIAWICGVLPLKLEMTMKRRGEQDLATAMKELKALRNRTSNCATCKRIREASGTWQTLEVYGNASFDLRLDETWCYHCFAQ